MNTQTGEKNMHAGFIKEKTKNRNQIRAVKKSNKGRRQTKGHREAIKESLREFCSSPATLVKAVNIKDGTTLFFPSGADFARYLGVSRQLVSQALKKWRTNKAVRGWTVSRVGFSEILPNEIVLVEGKLLGLSVHDARSSQNAAS